VSDREPRDKAVNDGPPSRNHETSAIAGASFLSQVARLLYRGRDGQATAGGLSAWRVHADTLAVEPVVRS